MMAFRLRVYLPVTCFILILPLASMAGEEKRSSSQAPPVPAAEQSPRSSDHEPLPQSEPIEESPPNFPDKSGPSPTQLDVTSLETEISELRQQIQELELRLDQHDQMSNQFAISASNVVADKVHVFIMADDRLISGGQQNGIAKGAGANARKMKSLLESQCTDTRSNPPVSHLAASGVRVLKGVDFRFQKLQQELVAAPIQPNDVLFVYIACHGLTFSEGTHGFQMPRPNTNRELMKRSVVWDLMKSKGARQTILISDCCANQVPVSDATAASVALAGTGTSALSRLLLYQIGDVDINGCSRPPADAGDGRRGGQFGIYREDGGFFTVAFEIAAVDTPVPVSWKSLFANCQTKLDVQFIPPVPVTVPGKGRIFVARQTLERIPD